MNDAPASVDIAPPERLHPMVLITGLGPRLRGLAGFYAVMAYFAATGNLTLALLAGGGIMVALIVGLILYWRHFAYRVGAHEIRIDSGILSRTHRSIPFDRVQDVDITQGPLARMLGIATVKFETGGSAAGSNDDGMLPGIALARAEALRQHVRARRAGLAPVSEAAETTAGEPAPIFAMDLKRVLTAGVFNFSLALLAALFGASQTIGDVMGVDPFDRSFWRSVLTSSGPLAAFVAAHQVATAVGGLVVLILVGLATGIVRTLLREYGFRLDRTGTGLRRRRGLLTRTDVTLPLRRVQAALVLTGPVRDRFGWRELKLQSLARDEGGKGDHVVAPLASDAEMALILAELDYPAPRGADAVWEPLPLAFVWTFILALAPLVLVGIAQSIIVPPAGALFLAALLAAAAIRYLAWRRSGFALDGERLHLRTGWWRRRTVILPLGSVQSVDLNQNFLGRRFGLASLVIGVAGGSGYSGHAIRALNRERASEVRSELLSRFA